MRYRGRFSPDGDDGDLTQTLDLDLGDRSRDPWTFHLSGLGSVDLDGKAGSGDVFFDLSDTHSSSFHGRLYELYADAHRSALATMRVGRMTTYEAPVFLWFDGALAETEELTSPRSGGLRLGAYGGQSVHANESSPEGDLLWGLYAIVTPWSSGRLRVDWLHAEDETLLGDQDDDLLSLELWQRVDASLDTYGAYSRLDGAGRDLRLRGTYATPGDLLLQISYHELLTTQRDLTTELDPFFSSLLELFPFREAQVLLTKDLGERTTLVVGGDLRRVSDSGDVGRFNRDFERYHATGVRRDVVASGVSVSVSAEAWSGEDDVRTWGASVDAPLAEHLDFSLGSFFSLYKFDIGVDDEERQDVRTNYLRLKQGWSERTSIEVSYEFEDNDLADVHILRLGLSHRF